LPLGQVARVALPGPGTRFDYAALDPGTGRLWVAHMDAGELLAVDTKTRKVVATIRAPGVHGVIAVPRLDRVYASATDIRQVLTIDSHTGRVLARAPAGVYPDGLAYDPVSRRVFVSDESGGVETVIAATGRRIATIPLGGEAGNVQYDAGSGDVLVDVQTRNQIAIIDPRTRTIVRRLAVPGCDNDHSLYVDSPRRLAFVACDGNATLLTLDLRTMKFTGRFRVGRSPDVLASTPACGGFTCRPRVERSRCSSRPGGAHASSAPRSSRRRLTPSPSTRRPISSTSRCRATRQAALPRC
jgi:DNA-binding beta-propeller fold protein YncE